MGSTPIGISASRGAAVLGLSQWATPVTVWAQIMEARQPGFCVAHGIEPPDPVDNAAVRWGSAFEEAVIHLAEEARGMKIGSREALCELNPARFLAPIDPANPDALPRHGREATGEPPITCHLDGIYEDGALHEGKTTSAFAYREKWGEPGSDRIPREYAVQVQHQMMCSGASRAIISALVFPTRVEEFEAAGAHVNAVPEDVTTGHVINPFEWARLFAEMGFFHQYEVTTDAQLQGLMLEVYRDFWANYVATETPPPPNNWDDIKRLIPEPRGTVIATSAQERLANEYAQINEELAQASKRQDQIKTDMIAAIERGAEHPIDSDSVEALILRDSTGRKIASYSKDKRGRKVFRCGG